jgi:hypothetical protein
VGNDYTGWWIYILGPVIGAVIAVAIIGAIRGLSNKHEREAAQGGAMPMLDTPTPDRATAVSRHHERAARQIEAGGAARAGGRSPDPGTGDLHS